MGNWTRSACLALIGGLACAATASSPEDVQPPPCGANTGRIITTDAISIPSVDTEHDVEVGGALLSTSQVTIVEDSIQLLESASVQGKRAGGDFIINLPAMTISESRISDRLYLMPQATFKYARENGERHGISKPDVGIYVDPKDPMLLKARVSFGLSSQEYTVPGARFVINRCVGSGTKGFRQEILYSGGAKGVITLQYREFIRDLARPAFSQQLTYDLADGMEIGFKGARIKVIRLSNTGLTYVVLRPLSPPE